ncbi:hypothetical protein KUL42_32490 [Alteromonas sp. KUL42]|uniref:hypothetical protein n=1 Tax=Alteromonas sp. KUL42 TaxID=2480797 RepID=UPI00103560CA|nr:hypothetical protein [Alteromonas sp. KUL42]TAP33269.1 hypothetical protein EYR97_15305 [Alteromonas sp. KUL42]GEA08488.1 hypothetical protein KUL42_32490 [Alteromonas sp. KUL42]
MDKLVLSPLQSAYSIEDGNETHRIELDGGLGRYRKDIIGASNKVTASWLLDANEYAYLRAFYRTTTKSGSVSFLVDLIINYADVSEYEAFFMPESLRLDGIEGGMFKCSATLEVKQKKPEEDIDEALVMIFNAFGSDTSSTISIIEHFANNTLIEFSENV